MTGSESAEVAVMKASGASNRVVHSDVKSNEALHSNGEGKENEEKIREAAEVYLLMHRNCRVSRNIRVNWYFEHLDKPIQIYSEPTEMNEEMLVYGMTAVDGSEDEQIGRDRLMFTRNTKMIFFARLYRQVYVLDLSPSTLVSDDEAGCCLFTLLMEHFKACLYSLTRQMVLPGNQMTIRPVIYLSVLVYIPYLTFEEKTVLVQGTLVNHLNVHEVVEDVEDKFKKIIQSLHKFSKPIIDSWTKKNDDKKRERTYRSYKAPLAKGGRRAGILKEEFVFKGEDENDAEDEKTGVDEKEDYGPPGSRTRLPSDNEMATELEEMGYTRQQWDDVSGEATATEEGGAVFANASSLPPVEGYIHPEWSLIYMIRMAILAIQMLPENTQSSIILITDALCGIPEQSALHDLLTTLRSTSIACSFIQVQGRVHSSPSFGHVASCELFHFLAVATFGAYLPNCKCILKDVKKGLNTYQKQLMCFWFEKALQRNNHILSIVRDVNEMFADMYLNDVRRHLQSRLCYECSVRDLMSVRLREGYTVKEIRDSSRKTVIVLILPIRQLSCLEYTITSRGPLEYKKRQKLKAEVTLIAPYNVLQELIAAPTTANPTRQKAVRAYRDIIDGIVESDRILTHLHSFFTQPSYYTIPEGLSHCAMGLFRREDPPPTKLDMNEEFFTRPRFDKFWCQLIDIEERIWQKWTHTHNLRFLLTASDEIYGIFSNSDDSIDFTKSLKILRAYLTKESSFCLLQDQIYIYFVGGGQNHPPRQFYLLRVTGIPPLITLRVSFIGGMTNHIRIEIMRKLADEVSLLRFHKGRNRRRPITEENSILATTLLKRPVEQMMITYKGIPTDVHSIIAHASSSDMIPSVNTHNALAKFLQARRIIWKLASMFCDRGGDLPTEVTNYFADMILRRRLSLGYQLIWLKRGIVGLCRQTETDRPATSLEPNEAMMAMSEESRITMEQFIIFPPMHDRSEINRISASLNDPDPLGCSANQIDVVVVQEMWIEPGTCTDQACRLLAEEVLLASLFTLDKLLRICAIGGPAQPVKTFARNNFVRDGTETRLIQFSLGSLMRNSQRHLMLLPFHCNKGIFDEDLRRAQMTIDILHEQLKQNSECTLEVEEKYKWTEMVGDLERQTDQFADINRGSRFVLYMRKTSPWSVVGVAIPCEKEKMRDWRDGALPLLFFSSEEPSVALAAMTGGGGTHHIEDIRQTDSGEGPQPGNVPDDFVLKWRGKTEGGGFKAFNLTTYVRNMYEHLIMKAMVTSMFKAVNDGILVSEKAVQDVTEEYCDFIQMEVEGVDEALRTVCCHTRMESLPTVCPHAIDSKDNSPEECEACIISLNALNTERSSEDVDFELSFSSLLSRYFSPVTGSPSYYHYISKDSPLCKKLGTGRFLNRVVPSMGKKDGPNHSSDDDEECLLYKTRKGRNLKRAEDIFPMRMYSIDSSDESMAGSLEDLVDISGNEMTPLGQRRARFENSEQYPTPIFLYFSCGVRLPTGEMETFPITSLPSCIHQIVRRANLPLVNYNIDDVRVSVDLYILTWPLQLDAHTAGLEGASYATAKRRTLLQLLPSKERAIVERLSHSISYLIEQEMVLMDSRRKELNYDRIEKISKFIARETKKKKREKDGRYDAITKRLGLVISTPEAKERLKERIDGIQVDYAMLKRVGDSDLFYACRVNEPRRFARHFVPIEKEKPPPAPIVVITPAMKRAMKEESVKKAKESLEARVRAVKMDVMKSLGYREDEELVARAREVQKELREEFEKEEELRRSREAASRKKKARPVQLPTVRLEREDENGEIIVIEIKRGEKIDIKRKVDEAKEKETTKGKEEKAEQTSPKAASEETGPPQTPLDPEAERLRELQEIHDPQIPLGRRKIIDVDTIDLSKNDVMSDFWVIVKVTDTIQIQFAQRYVNFRHTLVFDETWRKVKRALKVTNQQMLLEKAHETMEVNSLLLISDRERREYGSACIVGDGSIEGDPDSVVEEDNSRDQVTESARFYYTPGEFSCPMVHHHWFVVPPRLRTCIPKHQQKTNVGQGMKHRDPPETTAIDVLRSALHAFAASNVENVYLFKDRMGSVFYMHLHADLESVEKMSKSVPVHIRREAESEKFKTNLLLAIHGVDRPNEEITTDLPDMLQRQLNASHLDKIISMFAKNKKAMLDQPDVLFIQPEPRRPSRIYHFSVPDEFATAKLMAAFDFYVRQHLSHEWPEVRYRSSRPTAPGSIDRLNELRLKSCTQMSITPVMDGKEEQKEERAMTEETFEGSSHLAVSIAIPNGKGGDTSNEDGERQEILEIMGIAETTTSDGREAAPMKAVRSAPEVKREKALRKLSGHIHRGKKCFEAHTSVMTPKLPPNYYPKFNVICKPKEAGSAAYGFAIAELRLMATSGSVIDPGETELTDQAAAALFETSDIGEEQFETLTRCDRTEFTAHKKMERLMHGRFSRFFKNETLDKFPHSFMVELVVWEMGDVGDEYVEKAALAFIRQALADCVTEYYMFTRQLVDKPKKDMKDENSPMKPAGSQPMDIPAEKEIPRAVSLSLDDAILMSHSSGSYGVGEPCCKSEGAPAFLCGDFELRKEQAIPGMTGSLLQVLSWFDYVAASVTETAERGGVRMMAVQRHEVECASVQGAKKVIDVINHLLRGNRYARSDSYPDDVRVCTRLAGQTVGEGEETKKEDDSFPGASRDQWEGIESDLGVDLDDFSPEESPGIVVVAFSIAVWEDSIRYAREAEGLPPDSLLEMKQEDKREQFEPRFPDHRRSSFIPRLRFVTVTLTGKKVTLYSYNLRQDLHTMMVEDLRTAVQWHEARMLLLRQIGLHKMGITHLAPTQELPYEEGGQYATRIWRCTESYLESDFPPGHSCEITPKECVLSMSRLYRGIEPAFVTAGILKCFVDDQFSQLQLIRMTARSQLLPHHYLTALHSRMMIGRDKITYADLCELVNASREIHFVMTPLLLFPRWRRKIAGIRAPEKERDRMRMVTGKSRYASSASGFGVLKGASSGRGRTVSTLSASNSHASGLSLPPSGKSPSLRQVTLGEDDDPLHHQLEIKLLSEYVEYLISLGMKPVTVDRRQARTGRQPTGGNIVRWNLHPEQWMVTAVDGGLLLAHLCFTPPYFHVRFRMWHLLGVFSAVEDDHEKLKMRNLERAKDDLVSACHVHSFTYDFHLRMLSKYLLGRDHILFMPGYNTSAFLVDFLQYYGCRPPCARNCIYEERTSFSLQHGVHAEDVWSHFLKHDRMYGWRVVKMKQTDDDDINHQTEFMLVQSAVDMHGERDEVKIVVHDRSVMTPSSLHLAIYMIVVNKSHKTPLSDERRREDSRASEGEFKHVAPFHPPPAVPMKDDEEGGDERETDRDNSGASSSIAIMSGLHAEIERMVNLVNEGLLPSVVDGSLSRRRRFSSDGLHAAPLTLPTDQPIPIVLTPRTGDSDSFGSVGSLVSPPSPSMKVPPDNQLTIQDNAPRRHRRREESRLDGAGLLISQERAIYVHFLSSRQRKLQKIVEDATTKYRLQLQKYVQDAEFACRRDTLWQRMVAMPRHPTKTQSGGFFRAVITDPWQVARTATVRGKNPSKDLETLISIVHKEKMSDKEPGLSQLTRGLQSAALCKHLVARFGVDRCRFFESKHATNKKGLLITNPNCLLDAAVLISCIKDTSPELIMMIKEYDDDESVSDQVKKFKQAAIDGAFDEVVSTVIAYVWSTLNTRIEVP